MIACHQAMFVRREHCPTYANHLKFQGDLNWVMDILFAIPKQTICYHPFPIVNFKSGGFSNQHIPKQLKTHLYLIQNQVYFLIEVVY